MAAHLLQHRRLLANLDEVQRIGHQDAVEWRQIQRVGEVGLNKVDIGIGIALHEGAALAIERTGIAVHGEDLDLLAEHVAQGKREDAGAGAQLCPATAGLGHAGHNQIALFAHRSPRPPLPRMLI